MVIYLLQNRSMCLYRYKGGVYPKIALFSFVLKIAHLHMYIQIEKLSNEKYKKSLLFCPVRKEKLCVLFSQQSQLRRGLVM